MAKTVRFPVWARAEHILGGGWRALEVQTSRPLALKGYSVIFDFEGGDPRLTHVIRGDDRQHYVVSLEDAG